MAQNHLQDIQTLTFLNICRSAGMSMWICIFQFLLWIWTALICIFFKSLIADGTGSFPVVMVGGVLEANKKWDIGKEVISCIHKIFPGACPIKPKVSIVHKE